MSQIAPTTLQEDFTLLFPPETPSRHGESSGLFLVLVVVTAVFASWTYFRWRRVRMEPKAISEPPHVLGLRELSLWEDVTDETRYREGVAAVSSIVRRYTEARFGMRAPTLTAEEFWLELRADRKTPEHLDPFWWRLFTECDWVIYGGNTPYQDRFRRMVLDARDFVEATACHE